MIWEMPSGTAQPGSEPVFGVPAHCPLFPSALAANTEPPTALPASAVNITIPLEQSHAIRSKRAEVRMCPIPLHEGRGPPSSFFS
jgi:hypothetical protein